MADQQYDSVLSVQNLKKRIGRKWIIKDVTFDVKPGEIFGFLGPNGAGKTTTIRMLVDLIKPTEGKIKVCGYDVNRDPERALKYVGSIVENPEVYTYLTGWENLEHFARMQPGVDNERIQEVVDIVRLDQRIHDKVRTYSLGMRQRLGIAQGRLGDRVCSFWMNRRMVLIQKALRNFVSLLSNLPVKVWLYLSAVTC